MRVVSSGCGGGGGRRPGQFADSQFAGSQFIGGQGVDGQRDRARDRDSDRADQAP